MNLFSVSKIIKNQHFVFNFKECQVYDVNECSIKGEAIVTASNHGLYRLDTQEVNKDKGC